MNLNLINETSRIKDLMGLETKIVSSDDDKFCSSFKNQNEKNVCNGLERLVKESPWKNQLKNKIESLFSNFGKMSDEVLYDDISEYGELHAEKIQNITGFIEIISDDCTELKDTAIKSLEKLKKGRKILMYKKDGKLSYSYFNRLNTNYTALSILLTEYAISKNILNIPHTDIVKDFLSNSDTQNFMNDILIGLNYNAADKLLKTITKTRKIGNETEDKYKKYLNNQGIEYLDFSDDFGSVDFLGIDLMIKFPGQNYYSPVQVKSRFTDVNKLAINKYCQTNCDCYLVYPENGEWIKVKCGNNDNPITPEGKQVIKCKSITYSESEKYGNKYFCNGSYPNIIDKTKSFIEISDGIQTFQVDSKNVRVSVKGNPYFDEKDVKEIVV